MACSVPLLLMPVLAHASTLTINATNSAFLQHYFGTWSAMHASPANHVTNGSDPWLGEDSNGGTSYAIGRGSLTFDASALPAGYVIDSVVLHAYAYGVSNDRGDCMNMVSYTPSSYTTAVGSDFGNFGTTKFTTDIPISGITVSAVNNYTFNSDGIAAVTAGVFGVGLRTCNDISDTPGPNSAYHSEADFDSTGFGGTVPSMTITYHVPAASSASSASMGASSSASSVEETGSLVLFHSLCQSYTSLSGTLSGGTINYAECGSWDTSIEIPAMVAIRRQEAAIVYSAMVLAIHWFIRLFLILVVSRWLFRVITQYRKNHTRIIRRPPRR